jgi:hypothetical protein
MMKIDDHAAQTTILLMPPGSWISWSLSTFMIRFLLDWSVFLIFLHGVFRTVEDIMFYCAYKHTECRITLVYLLLKGSLPVSINAYP